jgi:hypothetical protein
MHPLLCLCFLKQSFSSVFIFAKGVLKYGELSHIDFSSIFFWKKEKKTHFQEYLMSLPYLLTIGK